MLQRYILTFFLLFITRYVFAINPIGWSLNEPFPAEILITGGSYSVTYTFTNQLPKTLVKPIIIEHFASPQTEFMFNDNCSGAKLAPKQSCTVKVTIEPLVIGFKEVQLTITGYDRNRVPLPALVTRAIQGGSGQVSVTSSVVTALPTMMTANTSAPFAFKFTNTGTAMATGVTTQSSSANFSSNCSATLLPGASCQITGNFTPTSSIPSQQTVIGTFRYAQGSNVIASSQTMVNPATGLTGVVSGLPATTVVGSSYQVTYTFTNNNSSTSPGMTITTNAPQANIGTCPGPSCTYLAQANTCPVVSGVLPNSPPGNTCYMTGLFTPSVTGNYSFQSTLAASAANPGPTSSTLTTSTTTVAAGGERTITFINQCNFKVWFSMNGGAMANSPNCTSDTDCPTGTACDPAANAGLGLCFWINPTPPSHTGGIPANPYELLPGVGTNLVTVPLVPDVSGGDFTQWSGNISASALCDGSTKCDIADCGNKGGSASCTVGQGFGQPATQFEITMIKNDRDYYDVEVINGFHIPIQVTPTNNPYSIPADEYNCSLNLGNPTAGGGFGSCNWNNASPPSPTYAYYWVTNNGSCLSDNSCTVLGEICGLDSNVDKVCGNFLGYWTADNACGVNATKAQPYFGCNNYLGSPYTANTYKMTSLYGCNTPSATQSTLNSCYTFNNSDCCGCANWNDFGITIPANTDQCLNTSNLYWTGQVQPTIQWMKQACPSYYTYPYDDKSSSFRCSNVASGSNTVGYTVTFCPGGNTGLPAGKNEGR